MSFDVRWPQWASSGATYPLWTTTMYSTSATNVTEIPSAVPRTKPRDESAVEWLRRRVGEVCEVAVA